MADFADLCSIFSFLKCILWTAKNDILFQVLLKFILEFYIDGDSALVHVMVWR